MDATDPAVREYLAELRLALAGRPEAERELVVDGVRQHVEDRLSSGVPARRALDDLGDPLAIAAEAGGSATATSTPGFLERRGGSVLVVLLLAVGGVVVPLLGWVVGVVLLWSSRGWRTVDKLVGTLAPPVLSVLVAVVGALAWSGSETTTSSGPVFDDTVGPLLPAWYDATWAAIVVLPLVQIAVAVYLLLRFRPRP